MVGGGGQCGAGDCAVRFDPPRRDHHTAHPRERCPSGCTAFLRWLFLRRIWPKSAFQNVWTTGRRANSRSRSRRRRDGVCNGIGPTMCSWVVTLGRFWVLLVTELSEPFQNTMQLDVVLTAITNGFLPSSEGNTHQSTVCVGAIKDSSARAS